MTLSVALYTLLTTGLGHGRAYPLKLPQKVSLPAVTYQIIPAEGVLHTHSDAHSGEGSASRFVRTRVQFSAWGTTYDEADALAGALLLVLDGYHGSVDGIAIGSILTDTVQDDHDPERGYYRKIIDTMIQYQSELSGS